MSDVFLAGTGTFVVWAAMVAVCDWRSRRVSNLLVLGGLAPALAFAVWQAGPVRIDAARALVGLLAGGVALMPFFLLGLMGAADVKVFAVLGAWFGIYPLLGLWIAASLVAGSQAVTLLVRQRRRVALAGRVSVSIRVGEQGTPYATFLTVPAILLALHASSGALS